MPEADIVVDLTGLPSWRALRTPHVKVERSYEPRWHHARFEPRAATPEAAQVEVR
ncbi:hypothetical protein GCM10017774_28280 [Lentzea cavernae]|uniref:Uncharacterized protein n=1 Tax=Lentzea cavernae TaxID=2020703 RepID=A0ABQ3MLA9_9PSEU|nr:hypothetical protein GCM10017774_28280 [Lentzea cavernae]